MVPTKPRMPLAVVGVSALFPGSQDADGFWRDVLTGRDLLTDVPPSHWLIEDFYDPDPSAPDKTYVRRGAFLDPVDFDPLEHGIPPNVVPATDTSQLLSLILAKKVLDDATRGDLSKLDRERVSVILGTTSAQELVASMASRLQRPVWVKALREHGLPEDEVDAICENMTSSYSPWVESTFPGLLGNVVAGRIANRMDLGGTNCVIDAACASTLGALSMAASELYLGDADMVITGGVETLNDIFMFMCFSKTPALSPSEECRPFSAEADGTMLGEGLAMFAVRRLADAERDGDRIYGVIRGVGSSSDGRAKSIYAPVGKGQAKALTRAYELAGYGPETVELVEAHGTATKAGDAAEFEGLRQAFESSGCEDRQWCALGSIKSQIGHTKAAAGAAGLFKALMAVHHKVLPPTIKVGEPNPALGLTESPFYLNSESRPWIRSDDQPRRASVSSFGFGGSNFHVAMEEYTGTAAKAWRTRTSPTELVVLAAESPEALAALSRSTAADAVRHGGLEFFAHHSQEQLDPRQPARLAVVASDAEDLAAKLEEAAAKVSAAGATAFSLPSGIHYEAGTSAGQTAFLFPGQGSQYPGMGRELAMTFDAARRVWDRAAGLSITGNGHSPLHEVVFPRPAFSEAERKERAERLTATEWAQPALGVTSAAQLALLRSAGVEPDFVAGHSFGELTALYAAGALDFQAFLRLARRRGELMVEAAEQPGAMLAVRHSVAELEALIRDWDLDVVVANYNSPRQAVLAGPTAAIEDTRLRLKERGVTASPLSVSTAFHSPLMAPAGDRFREYLAGIEFGQLAVPAFSNAEAARYGDGAEHLRTGLANQIARPVRFAEEIEALYEAGARTFVEVGPGHVLTRLVTDCLEGRPHRAIHLDRRGHDGLTTWWNALGRLAVAGIPVRWAALWEGFRPPADPRQSKKKPALSLALTGANYGKPYPPPEGAEGLPQPNPSRPAKPPDATVTPPANSPTSPTSPTPAAPRISSASSPSAVSPSAVSPSAVSPALTAPAAPVSAPSAAVQGHPAWVQAYGELQRQTAETHAVYQRAMADSHVAYLRTAESSLATLGALATGAVLSPPIPPKGAVLSPPIPPKGAVLSPPIPPKGAVLSPPILPKEAVLPAVQAEAPALPALAPSAQAVPAQAVPAQVVPARAVTPTAPPVIDSAPTSPIPTAEPVEPPKPSAGGPAVSELLLEVVSEKTGYPTDLLQMEMDIESDLGIDSIKRVEILSALQDKVPSLPQVEPGEMGALRTLGEIVDRLGTVEVSQGDVPPPPAPAVTPATAPAAAPSAAVSELLLEVVSEKTGYPTELLQMEMDVESDLGIDSIKRVEILSALQDKVPSLPEVEPGEMGALRTLGEIVDRLGRGGQSTAVAPASASATAQGAPVAQAAAPGLPDAAALQSLLLEVVSEKTGYPADLLRLEMDVESDLGIDSIKRVEILSAVQDRVPGLPEVDSGELGALRTLGQIVAYLDTEPGAPAAAETAPTAAAVTAPVEALEAAAAPACDDASRTVARFALRSVAAPPSGFTMAGLLAGGTVAVTDDGTGVAPVLCDRLRAQGLQARVVTQVPEDATAVIFLGGLREISGADEAIEVNRQAFRSARAVAARFADAGGVFVTVQDTGGDFGLAGREAMRAWSGGLPGLAKTAAHEWPRAACKAIDLERGGRAPQELADALARELLAGGPEREVGLAADGSRTTLESSAAEPPPGEFSIDESSVVVATGGGRGVTAVTLVELARRRRPRIALLGRTELSDEPPGLESVEGEAALIGALADRAALPPAELRGEVRRILANRELRSTIAALRGLGSEVLYLTVDVRDEHSLAGALDQVRRRLGPVTGLVHGAGVLADKLIHEKTDEQFSRVFDTKVLGLRALLAATIDDPLRFLCLFSSVAARYGNTGQSDYAMANEVMNKVAAAEARRRGPGCVVRSLNWGPWDGGMVSPALKAHFQQAGIPLIPLEAGARALVDETRGGCRKQVEVQLGGGLPQDSSRPRDESRSLDLLVSEASHPYLDAHRIRDVPIVPVVLVLEWFVRAAGALYPGLEVVACRDLKVLRGVRLESFSNGGQPLTVRCRQTQPQDHGAAITLTAELCDHGGNVHYSAGVELAAAGATPSAGEPLGEVACEPLPPEVYGEHLFHGPAFQVIRCIDELSAEKATAVLAGTREAGWSGGPWSTDTAALDGGLQLAILWGIERLGRSTLPTRIGAFINHTPGLVEGPIRCVLEARSVGRHRTVSDLVFVAADGRRLAEMQGVEMTVLPKDVLPKDVLPKDVLPEDVLPKDVLPEDRVPKDVLPEDRVPKDVLPEDRVPEGEPATRPPVGV